jgi:hypothetical protein
MYQTYPAKSGGTGSPWPQIGQKHPVRVAHNDPVDLPLPIEKNGDSSTSIPRELGQGTGERGGHEVSARNPARREGP